MFLNFKLHYAINCITKKCILHLKLKARHVNFFDKDLNSSERIFRQNICVDYDAIALLNYFYIFIPTTPFTVLQKHDVRTFHTQFSIYCLLKKQSFSQIGLFSPYFKMSIIVKCFRLITIYNHLSKKPFIRSYAVKSIYKEKRGENGRLYGLLWEKQKSFQFRWRWCY